MICRLCLMKIESQESIPLYQDGLDVNPPSIYIDIMEKYLYLKISPDDSISLNLCQDCGQTLRDFDRFFLMVEEKQKSLVIESISLKNEPFESNYDSNEVVEEAVGNVGDHEMEIFKDENIQDEQMFDEDILNEKGINVEELSVLNGEQEDGRMPESSDDDAPLARIKQNTKTVPKQCKKSNQRVYNTRNGKSTSGKKDEKKRKKKVNQSKIIKQNEEIITKQMKLICDLCSVECASFANLRIHFWEVHKEKKAYLKCCNNKYGNASKLVDHLKWHQNPEAYKCKFCNKRLKGHKYLDVHMATKHNDLIAEDTKDYFSCAQCPRRFRSELYLKKHIEKHESGQPMDFKCDLCGKRFINIHRLRRHIESIHEDLHPYVCDICGRKFKFKPSFEKHILEHQGITVEEPKQCEDCGKWLKNYHTLKLHRLSHESKNASCSYCGKTCPSKLALQSHIKYMHKEKTLLQCSYCEKGFKDKRSYQEHLAVHTGALLYSCQYCAKEFRSKSNMYVHVKRRHTAEWMEAKMAKSNDPNHKKTPKQSK